MNALSQITPRAFDAIVGQLCRKGHRELTCYATIDGQQIEWTAFFEEEEDPYLGLNEYHERCPYTRCSLVGAYDSECLWAGNRDEITAIIGDAAVAAWETQAEERANG